MSDTQPSSLIPAGILALQEQKRELAQAALSGKSVRNISKLTLNDLMGEFPVGRGMMYSRQQRCSAVVQERPMTQIVMMASDSPDMLELEKSISCVHLLRIRTSRPAAWFRRANCVCVILRLVKKLLLFYDPPSLTP